MPRVSQMDRNHRAGSPSKRGFTMVETLTVVAIMVILFAVAAPNVIAAAHRFEASKLNSRAQGIYNTVQNRVSALQSNGNLQALSNRIDSSHLVQSRPADYTWASDDQWDAVKAVDDHKYRDYDVYYVRGRSGDAGSDTTSGVSDAAITNLLMTNDAGQISRDLYAGGWLVELSPTTGEVYAVFYWENEQADLSTEDISEAYRQVCTWRQEGVANGTGDAVLNEHHVGYYCGGELSKAVHHAHERYGDLRWRLVNDEELYVMVCSDDLTKLEPSRISVTVTVRGQDESGDDVAWRYTASGSDLNMNEGSDEVDVILDSLRFAKTAPGKAKQTEQMSFYNIMSCDFGGTLYQDRDCTKEQKTHTLSTIITPGTDIDVSVELSYRTDAGEVAISSKSADVLARGWRRTGSENTLTTNSTVGAFKPGNNDNANDDGTVYLWATRHLRNISISDCTEHTYDWEDDSHGTRTGYTHLALADCNTTENAGSTGHYSGNVVDRDGDELMKNLQTGDVDFVWENNDSHCVSLQSRTADATTGKLNPLAYFKPIDFYGTHSYASSTRTASITGKYSDASGNAAGHTLRNFLIQDSDSGTGSYVGLFEHIGSPVSSLNLVNFTVRGHDFIGALAGDMVNDYVDLDDVHVYVDNKANGGAVDYASCGITSTGGYVGGIVGHGKAEDTNHIRNCSASINISGGVSVGGIIGVSEAAEISGCSYGMDANDNGRLGVPTITAGGERTGGLIGWYNREGGSFSGCTMLGNLTSSGNTYVGGIVGYVPLAGSDKATFSQCYVGCTPNANEQNAPVAAAVTPTITGGLNCGGVSGFTYKGVYTDCHVMANVTGGDKDHVGGVAGYTDQDTDFTTCSFAGTVTGKSSVGGIVGEAVHAAIIEDCTVGADDSAKIATIYASSNIAGGIGGMVRSGSSLKNCAVFATVQSGGTTADDGKVGGLLGADDGGSTTITACGVGSTTNPATIGAVRHNVGGLIGKHTGGNVTGAVGGSYVYAIVYSTEGGNHIGGLFGTDSGKTTISNYNVGSASRPASVSSFNPNARTDQDCDAEFVGGLSGQHKSGDVTNCHVVAQVSGCSKVGGLIGISSGSKDTISDCSFSFPLSDDLNQAGVYCPVWPKAGESVYIGGAFGSVSAAQIRNCSVVSNIYCLSNGNDTDLTKQETYAGGFAGHIEGDSALTIDSCHVSGTFDSGNTKLAYMCTDLNYQGGFIGRIDGSKKVAITHCYSAYGVVPVSDNRTENESMYVGGFVGYMDNENAAIDSCYVASVGWSADVTNRYPMANSTRSAVGGFVGMLEKGTISNSYTTANTSGSQLSGGFAGYAAADATSKAIFKNCTAYGLTTRSIDANVTIGGFCADKGKGTATFTNCTFLRYDSYNDWADAGNGCTADAQSYEQLASRSYHGHPYTAALGSTFPFPTVINDEHYGDWPAKVVTGPITFKTKAAWGDESNSTAQIDFTFNVPAQEGWELVVTFDRDISSVNAYTHCNASIQGKTVVLTSNQDWNRTIKAGGVVEANFTSTGKDSPTITSVALQYPNSR